MKNPPQKWQTLKSQTDYECPWFTIRKDQVLRPDGRAGFYHVLDTPGPAVFTIACDDQGRICLVHQERYPTGVSSWELPGGNAGREELLAAAKRELREEAGFTASRWKQIGKWETQNGICSEFSYVYHAEGLSREPSNHANEDGILEVRFFDPEAIFTMLHAGKMTDGQTIAGLLFGMIRLGYWGGAKRAEP